MSDEILADLQARIHPVQRQLLQAFQGAKIPKELYFKSLIQLSYEYAVAGYADETLSLVLQVPADYFRSVSARHMDEDPKFYAQAHLIADVLNQVHLLPTQKAANA